MDDNDSVNISEREKSVKKNWTNLPEVVNTDIGEYEGSITKLTALKLK